jgi:non-specific serine/threonine protein kinase
MPAIDHGASRANQHGEALFRGPLTRLIGRERELAAIEVLLDDPDVRLLTLTGPPGIGKTRLAMALAARAEDRGDPDVWFVPLASVSEPALVLPSIGSTIGASIERGRLVLDELARRIGGRRALLVLDNFEQVLPAATDVLDLLSRCPALTTLVTSRAALGLRCEREWGVSALALPSLERSESVERIAGYASVALLMDRATANDQHFLLSGANAGALAAICVHLEGIPLAIELAATWLKLYSPSALLSRLQQNLATLHGAATDFASRHRTMHDAIAWSDELLTASERRLFHRLAIFSGGWTFEAAERVAWSDDESVAIEDVMLDLVNKSLVIRKTSDQLAPRFRMLAMIRAYALAQLDFQHSAVQYRDRHAAYFCELGQEAYAHLYRSDQAIWLERLDREHANLRAALRWLIETGRRNDAMRLAATLENFWILRDHLFEGQHWLDEIFAMPGETCRNVEVTGRAALAALQLRTGEHQPARRLLDHNLHLANDTGDRVLAAETVHTLGISYWHAGDLEQGGLLFEHALRLAREAGDERVVARVLNHRGGAERLAGRDIEALRWYDESLAIWRRLADQERIAMVLHNMAPVVARTGDRERASGLFEESLEISYRLRNVHGVSLCLMGIAGSVGMPGTSAIQAARLLSGADRLRLGIGVRWDPDDRAEFERSLATVQGALDATTFAAAWEQGRSLSLDEAVALGRRLIRAGVSAPGRASRTRGPLTRREHEIAIHVALGETNREIAGALSIAEKTVEMHIGHSLTKLGFRSRAQLAAWIAEQSARLPAPADLQRLGG